MANPDKNSKEKKGGIGAVVGTLVLLGLLNFAGGGVIIALLVILIIGGVVFMLYKKQKEGSSGSFEFKSSAVNSVKNLMNDSEGKPRFDFSHFKNDPPEDETFSARPVESRAQYYDKSELLYDQERDRERRIKQLDGFLKNGIIDKNEYRVLKERYERNL